MWFRVSYHKQPSEFPDIVVDDTTLQVGVYKSMLSQSKNILALFLITISRGITMFLIYVRKCRIIFMLLTSTGMCLVLIR